MLLYKAVTSFKLPASLYPDYRDIVLTCRKKFLRVNKARPLEEGHVQRQARWKNAKLEDLLATRQQDTTGVVTVHRPLKRHRAGKKVALPGIKPRISGFSCQCSSH